jgi:hypothetical protein
MEPPSEVVEEAEVQEDSVEALALVLKEDSKEIEEIEHIHRTFSAKPENKLLIGKAHSSVQLKSLLKIMFKI